MNAKLLTVLIASIFLILFSISTLMFHDNFHDGWISYEKKDYEAAQKLWLPLASQGNSRAQFYLGRMYDKGQGIPQDYNEAVKWYQLAADRGKTNVYRIAKKGVTPALNILTDDAKQGIAEAQVALGVMHEYGYSFPQDNNEAFKWFQLAADRGKTNVYRIAKKGVTPALNILTSDAKQGIAKAQVTLGRMYDQGQGVAQDYSEALKWFQLAADQGYEQGKENIYRIAKKGVTPALNILTDDAKQGIAEAQVALGVMHEYGYSFPQDNNEAFKWYRLAADRGKTNVYRIAKKGVTPALNILTDDAKNGIAEAQFYLGVMYENGYQFPHDYNKAFNWYRQGKKQGFMQAITYSYGITKKGGAAAMKILTDDAKNGIAEAESNMGAMYEYGLQFEPDYDKAFNWYRLSAEHGYGSGKASIYRIAKKGVTPALNILTNDAKNGVAEAQIVLGTMHEHGYSFPQDNNEAFKWYRLATDQGYEQGKANIYRIAIKGDAVAMKILTDDAKNGDAKAQLYLGMMYELGHSFPLDNNEAFKWYQLAADQGYEQGKENIYRIAKKGVTPALNILTDDAKNGAAKAQLYLGMMYELGHSFPLDNNEAFKWFQLAANQGYEQGKENIYRIAKKGVTPALNILTDDAKNGAAKAQFYLGMMYELGHSFPLDNNEAFKWFQLAAKQGDDLAQIHLGQMYEKGHVVPQDYNEAVNRYRLVAEKRYSKAQLNLGIMYYKGRGVLQDNVQADMWFILASLQKDQEAIKYISLVEKKMSPQQIVKARVMARVWEP